MDQLLYFSRADSVVDAAGHPRICMGKALNLRVGRFDGGTAPLVDPNTYCWWPDSSWWLLSDKWVLLRLITYYLDDDYFWYWLSWWVLFLIMMHYDTLLLLTFFFTVSDSDGSQAETQPTATSCILQYILQNSSDRKNNWPLNKTINRLSIRTSINISYRASKVQTNQDSSHHKINTNIRKNKNHGVGEPSETCFQLWAPNDPSLFSLLGSSPMAVG